MGKLIAFFTEFCRRDFDGYKDHVWSRAVTYCRNFQIRDFQRITRSFGGVPTANVAAENKWGASH